MEKVLGNISDKKFKCQIEYQTETMTKISSNSESILLKLKMF